MRAWLVLCLIGLSLLACDEAAAPDCVALGQTVADGQRVDDPDSCLSCVCVGGEARCQPLPGCGPDATPGLDAAPHPDAAMVTPDADAGDAGDAAIEIDAGPLCTAADTRCLDAHTLRWCDDADPAALALRERTCAEGERCLIDHCSPPLCAPGELLCRFGRRVRCDEAGFPSQLDPCPAEQVCAEGACIDPQPEVLLLVDTSGSMAEPVGPPGAVQPFPACEPPEAPFTRLGLVKTALTALFDAPEAEGLRMALMHFPQQAAPVPACPQGQYSPVDLPNMPNDLVFSADDLAQTLPLLMAVPFSADSLRADDRLRAWTNFEERVINTGRPCADCDPAGACRGDVCYEHTQPELRPIGGTPIGRSLFVAAEYVRQHLLREGAPCETAVDCGAPYYQCVDGRCHDPLGACRTRTVILFTDGGESYDNDPAGPYYPPTQAKRMNMGLMCAADVDCPLPAVCVDGQCHQGTCFDDLRPCLDDTGCPQGGPCGQPQSPTPRPRGPLSGLLTHPDGSTARLTVSVVDSSATALNQHIAEWGGGRYLHVRNFSVAGLVEAFRPLFVDAKDQALRCVVGD